MHNVKRRKLICVGMIDSSIGVLIVIPKSLMLKNMKKKRSTTGWNW